MNYKLHLNLISISLKNANQKHIDYFKSQFFNIEDTQEALLNINIDFNNIQLSKDYKILEDTFYFDSDNNTYILDTQKNKAKLNFNKMNSNNIYIEVDIDFDLYYLYSHIIEPLFIIFGVEKDILFIHSSSVEKDNKGTLYPAWRHTGKTHLLLKQTLIEDFSFMGDDFTLVFNNRLYLYPKMINLFSYNLKGFPKLYSLIDGKTRNRLLVTTKIKDFLQKLSYNLSGNIAKVFFRLSQLAEVSTNFKTNPESIGIKVTQECSIDNIIILQRANYSNKPKSINLNSVSLKISKTIEFEIEEFLNIYKKSCYISGIELNKSIELFSDNYSTLVKKYLKDSKIKMVKPE